MSAKEVYNISKGKLVCVRVPGLAGQVSTVAYLHITRASLKIQYNKNKTFDVIEDSEGYVWIDGLAK